MCKTKSNILESAVDSSQTQTDPMIPPPLVTSSSTPTTTTTTSNTPNTAMASNAGSNQLGSGSGPSIATGGFSFGSSSSCAQRWPGSFSDYGLGPYFSGPPANTSTTSSYGVASQSSVQPLNSSFSEFGRDPYVSYHPPSTASTFCVAAQPPISSSRRSCGFTFPPNAPPYPSASIPYGWSYSNYPPCFGSSPALSYSSGSNPHWDCCLPGYPCFSAQLLRDAYLYGNQFLSSGFGLPPMNCGFRLPSHHSPQSLFSFHGGTTGTQPYNNAASAFGSSSFGSDPFGSRGSNICTNPTGTTGTVANGNGSANTGLVHSSAFGNTGINLFTSNAVNGQSGSSTTSSTSTSGGIFGSQASLFNGFGNAASSNSPSANIFGAQPSFSSGTSSGLGQPFGNSPANSSNTGIFGLSTTCNNSGSSFGSKPYGSSSSLGTTPSTGGIFGPYPFGTSMTSGSSFTGSQPGTSIFGFGRSAAGSSGSTVKFTPLFGTDVVVKNGAQCNTQTRNCCISMMKEYDEKKSMEELRLEDYQVNQKSASFTGSQPGTSVFGFGRSAAGPTGSTIKFTPVFGTDVVVKNGAQCNMQTRNCCISMMKEYGEKKSMEELRLEDHQANRKSATAGSSALGGVFGSSQQPAAGGSLFGGNSNYFTFGSAANKPFGAPTGIGNASQPSQVPAGEAVTVNERPGFKEVNIFGSQSFRKSPLQDYVQNGNGTAEESSVDVYGGKSIEESRVEDYMQNRQGSNDGPIENFRSICMVDEVKSPEELKFEYYYAGGMLVQRDSSLSPFSYPGQKTLKTALGMTGLWNKERTAANEETTLESAVSTSADGEAKVKAAGPAVDNKERMKQLRTLLQQIDLEDRATETGDSVRTVRGTRTEAGDELFLKLMLKKGRDFVLSGLPAALVEADLRAYVESLGVEVYRVEILAGDGSETAVAVIAASERCQQILMNAENWPENVVVTME